MVVRFRLRCWRLGPLQGAVGLRPWGQHGRLAYRTHHASARAASTTAAASSHGTNSRAEAYLRRDSNIRLSKETVGQVLQRTAERFPERPAVISHYQKQRITFHELLRKADQLGAGLLALGLARGERVAVWGPNSLEWVLAKMACARAGLVLVRKLALHSCTNTSCTKSYRKCSD